VAVFISAYILSPSWHKDKQAVNHDGSPRHLAPYVLQKKKKKSASKTRWIERSSYLHMCREIWWYFPTSASFLLNLHSQSLKKMTEHRSPVLKIPSRTGGSWVRISVPRRAIRQGFPTLIDEKNISNKHCTYKYTHLMFRTLFFPGARRF
jgi:hypothetical protein